MPLKTGQFTLGHGMTRSRRSGRKTLCAVSGSVALLLALPVADVHAQAGIGVLRDATATGTIGHNKADIGSGALVCPAGSAIRGAYHRDKSMTTSIASTRGMTAQLGLYCATIRTNGATVTVNNLGPNGTPDVSSIAYANADVTESGYCPVGQVVSQFGGWDRQWTTVYPAWSSAVRAVCRPLNLNANSWVQMNTGASLTDADAGVRETVPSEPTLPAHVYRGPFCPNSATSLVAGTFLQAGGEGYDGINVYCGGFLQARHSAVMTFTDFAWSQTLGGSGWLVNLNQGSTLLDDGAGMTGANKVPHATVGANTSVFQANEVYVLPGSNYLAAISQRPSGIAANTFVTTGSCLNGASLVNEQDASCTMQVTGKPDIGVTMAAPASPYSSYGQIQTLRVTATNHGAGDTDGDDGFTLVTTLSAGWQASGALPANCVASAGNTVVTCALNPTSLAAASAPGGSGGVVNFDLPVTAISPTAAGSYTASVALGRATPDGDGDATNDDFNTANDNAIGPLEFQAAAVTISKTGNAGTVVTGANVTYTIVVTNSGPPAANNTVVRDDWTSLPGLDCSAGPATCAASGTAGTQCPSPASTTPAGLQAGLAIPVFPSGGIVSFVLSCVVTASGQ